MKVSDYVVQFLVKKGITKAFVITGGCIVHMIDSISKNSKIDYVAVQHEQAGAMAADGYARVSDGVGLAMATSGPGATNLLTGVLCSYYDSIPLIIITGQVPSSHLKRNSKTRQIGFQETDVISIYETATKHCVLIDNPETIKYELQKAYYIANNGRPGPVLLDICDDVQRAEINPDELTEFTPHSEQLINGELDSKINDLIDMINKSIRPVLIYGNGIRLSNSIKESIQVAEQLGIPIVPTWAGLDYLPHNHELVVGCFGVTSGRAGNFTIQNSDLIITVGTRLDTHETGPILESFAREAKRVMVDIDKAEIEKFKERDYNIDLPICADARDFFRLMLENISNVDKAKWTDWIKIINKYKIKYPICLPEYEKQKEKVNPYYFMDCLSNKLKEGDIIFSDCGGNLIWTMQGIKPKKNQRIISAFNHSPMGYAVPASIGAAFASNKEIFCITGDGGLQMNVQELATIEKHNLPIKIILFNNHGHGIIRNTLETWLEGNYQASTPNSGLPDPNYIKIAKAYGLKTISISSHNEIPEKMDYLFSFSGPLLCNVELLPSQKMIPKLTYGKPIEDPEPLLPRNEFNENMIIQPFFKQK